MAQESVNGGLEHRGRAIFSPSQVKRIYERIGLPQRVRYEPGPEHSESAEVAQSPERGLELLSLIQRHSLASIPFENLSMHYSKDRAITIDPQSLFEKIVDKHDGARPCNRGGYCMEVNNFLLTLLRSVGFEVYAAIGRTSNQFVDEKAAAFFKPCTHQVTIARIGQKRYLVDIGVGTGSIVEPFLMDEQSPAMSQTLAGDVTRLTKGPIDDLSNREGPNACIWTISRRSSDGESWVPLYCFQEMESLPGDFDIINYYTSTSPKFWLRYAVLVVKALLGEDGKIKGMVRVYNRTVKKIEYGQADEEFECETEGERLQAIEQRFGITLTDEEKAAVVGTAVALPGARA